MPTKQCTGCQQRKPVDQFHWRSRQQGLRISRCRDCAALWSKNHYSKNRHMYLDKASAWNKRQQQIMHKVIFAHLEMHPCVDCGEDDPVVLEFDHVRGTKAAGISELVTGKCSVETLQLEIAKCDIRCANCHVRKTAKQAGYWKLKFR